MDLNVIRKMELRATIFKDGDLLAFPVLIMKVI